MRKVGVIYLLQRFGMQTEVNLTDPWGAVWFEVGKTIWLFHLNIPMSAICLPLEGQYSVFERYLTRNRKRGLA